MEKIASKGQAPKMIQPKFCLSESVQDYSEFREFLENFMTFTKEISDHLDKFRWLCVCVKGSAFELIKGLSAKTENYKIALDKLKEKYLNYLH